MAEPGREGEHGESSGRGLGGSVRQEDGGRPVREDGGYGLEEEAGGLALTSREDGRREDVEAWALTSLCGVCTAPATHHRHYGAVSCYSCRCKNQASPYFF